MRPLNAALWLLCFAACARQPAPSHRDPLIGPTLRAVTIDGETRPAVAIGTAGLAIDVPRGGTLRFALGVRPAERQGQYLQIAAAPKEGVAPAAPVKSAPRPRAVIQGRYRVILEGRTQSLYEVGPGVASWHEGALRLPSASRIAIRAEAAGTAVTGESVYIAEPVLLGGDPDPRPGACLISIDTLRADHLGCYGHEVATSPHLDRLSRLAALFLGCRTTAPWTLPGHLGLMTARYGSELGVTTARSRPDASVPTLAGVLARAGYACFGRANHTLVSERYGFDRGFSVYRVRQDGSAADSVDEALGFLDDHAGEAPFLFLHLFEPHWDYAPPARYRTLFDPDYVGAMDGTYEALRPYMDPARALTAADLGHLEALYDGEIAGVDQELGRLFRALRARDRGAMALAVTSDHGEEFKDHGSLGHGHALFEEELHVPLLLSAGAPPALRTDAASLLDVAPTMASCLHVPPGSDWRGRDLLAPASPPAVVLAETRLFGKDLAAALDGRAKSVVDFASSPPSASNYDLAMDPAEASPRVGRTLVAQASWLRYAFAPGLHVLAPGLRVLARASPYGGTLVGPDPEHPGLLHAYLGEAPAERLKPIPVLVTAPSGVRAIAARAARAPEALGIEVTTPGQVRHDAGDVETLKALGYLQ